MTINDVIDKWKKFVSDMNTKGIPLPTARDPKTGTGSVTFSLVVFSAGLCGLSIIFMLSTSVAKLTTDFTLNPETTAQVKSAFDSSFQFLIASLSAYLGRKFQKDPKGTITVEPENPSQAES